MTEINSANIYQPQNTIQNNSIEAHYSENMKVTKPKITSYMPPSELPKNGMFTDKEATKKMQQINEDIYVGAKKEKSNHGFNLSTFFKIFSGITLAAIIIACIRKFRSGK